MENKNNSHITTEESDFRWIYEATQARSERTIKRLILALIIATALIFASNLAWIYAWGQYDYSSEETQIDVKADKGNANFIGNDGDIINGSNNSDKEEENEN